MNGSKNMYKQIIIARKDLNLSPGKLAAQVAHGSIAFLTKMIKDNVIGEVFGDPITENMEPKNLYAIDSFYIDKGLYKDWIDGIFTKTVLEAKNKNQLLKATKMAEEMGMVEGEDFFLIKDCCLTELAPEEIDENGIRRTLTCIGFKPMPAEVIDKIGKKFQLYK
jgi:PTH2 family peptidyl-tRNA hydrolase